MKPFSFVQASDAHLGYMQYNLPQREADFTRAFREFVDKTNEVYPDFVVFAGDLFNDPHPSNVVLGETISLLDSLEVPVLVVPGSHDNVYSALVGTVLDPLHKGGHIHYLPVSPFERDDVYIYGMTNFRSRRAFQEECKEYFERRPPNPSSNYNIFVLHQGVDFPELGLHHEEVEVLPGELPVGFQYYASGHMHTGKVIHYGEAKFVYSGSLETYEYDQYYRPKTFNHVEVNSDGEATIKELRIEGYRKFIVLDEDFSEVKVTEIEERGKRLVEEADSDGVIIALVLRGTLPRGVSRSDINYDSIKRIAQNALHVHLVNKLKTKEEAESPVTLMEAETMYSRAEIGFRYYYKDYFGERAPEYAHLSVDLLKIFGGDKGTKTQRRKTAEQRINEFYEEEVE